MTPWRLRTTGRAVPESNPTSSESLMARFQADLDACAFDELVSRFVSPATAAARQILADPSLAEDAVQEAFLRVIRSRGRYVPTKLFSSWFFTILRNVCRDMLRHRNRQATLLRSFAADRDTRAIEPNSTGGQITGEELLAALGEKARAVITLRVIHGLAFRDIAAAMGISEEAAKKRAQRALRRLRELGRAMSTVRGRPLDDPDSDKMFNPTDSVCSEVPVEWP